LVTLEDLARAVDARLHGDGAMVISGVADLRDAESGQISFVADPKFREHLGRTGASAVVVTEDLLSSVPCAALVVADPYLAYARIAQILDPTPMLADGISADACIHETAVIAPGVVVAAGAVIEEGVSVGEGSQIGAGTVIRRNSRIGKDCVLSANVTIEHDVVVGDRVRIQAGTVVGSEGFGYAHDRGRWVRIPQIGRVVIGNDVEIGANCTIDRGAIKDTQIHDHVIIDNLVHIAHNVVIEEGCALAGCAAIAGSTRLGRGTTVAGGVGILGHLEIAPGSHFTARTLVSRSVRQPGAYSSGTGMLENNRWRKAAARFGQLDEMARKIKQLEREVENLSKKRGME
jgi:UDP-3-O-[3-hydroxymyristoyl] glucosamine N-acyltransferase